MWNIVTYENKSLEAKVCVCLKKCNEEKESQTLRCKYPSHDNYPERKYETSISISEILLKFLSMSGIALTACNLEVSNIIA